MDRRKNREKERRKKILLYTLFFAFGAYLLYATPVLAQLKQALVELLQTFSFGSQKLALLGFDMMNTNV